MSFEAKMESYIREQDLLAPGSRVICALSGGADSMALLWAMYLLRGKWELRLSAAHFNHGLRGSESDGEEAFVRDFCRRMDIPLTVGRGEIQVQGRGLEDAARRARYAFFDTLDEDALIATAHTADDNAETMLLHLVRGTGLRGLGGISPKRGRIIRPLLTHTRREVESFLDVWALRFVTDSSNLEDGFLRNRLRRQVMPVLTRENPQFAKSSARIARSLREDESFVSAMAEEAFGELCRENTLDCGLFGKLHPALQSRVMVRYLKSLGVREPEQVHLDACKHLALGDKPGGSLRLPGGVLLERQYQILAKGQEQKELPLTPLPIPGRALLGEWEVTADLVDQADKEQNTPYTFYISHELLSEGGFFLRRRQQGDNMRLSGGQRSVKKAMIDRKIPASRRDRLPVLVQGERVLAVAGLGVSWDCGPQESGSAIRIRVVLHDPGENINNPEKE